MFIFVIVIRDKWKGLGLMLYYNLTSNIFCRNQRTYTILNETWFTKSHVKDTQKTHPGTKYQLEPN